MKTTISHHLPLLPAWAALSLLASGLAMPIAAAKGKPNSTIGVEVTFDANNASDSLYVNGLDTDDGTSVAHGSGGAEVFVGAGFIVSLTDSNRTFQLDLSQALGCEESTGVNIEDADNAQCGDCFLNDGLSPQLDYGSGMQLIHPTVLDIPGASVKDLGIGETAPTTARLRFYDASGAMWMLYWGPYLHANSDFLTYNPGSGPVEVSRPDANTWAVTTTGDHLAALYRYDNSNQAYSIAYYGQFLVPFSATATALESQDPPSQPIQDFGRRLAAPEVSILSPADGQSVPSGTAIEFSGVALDHCVDASGAIIWTIDGTGYHTGSAFQTTLPDGYHTVTASVANRSGLISLQTIHITVGTPAAPVLSVQSIAHSLRKGGRDLRITVAVADSNGSGVSGADVTIDLAGPESSQATASTSNGTATFSLGSVASGSYTVTVTNVSHPDYDWDGVQATHEFTK